VQVACTINYVRNTCGKKRKNLCGADTPVREMPIAISFSTALVTQAAGRSAAPHDLLVDYPGAVGENN